MGEISIKESYVLHFDQEMTNKEVLSALCDNLCKQGVVKSTYKDAILKREEEYPTGLKCGAVNIAIPHADVEHVNQAAISVAVLKQPVDFYAMDEPDGTVPISMVIMLALTEAHGHLEMLQKVVGLIQNQDELRAIVESDDDKAVIKLMKSKLLS